MSSDVSTSPASKNSSEPQPIRGRWLAWLLRPNVAISLFLVFLVLLLPVLIRGYQLSQVPAAPEPFDTQAVLDFAVPDEQNAYVEYRQLATVLVELPRGDQDNLQSALDGEWRDVPQVIRQWVSDNRPAIELWKLGTAKPDAQYLRATKIDLRTQFPVNADMRTLAKLVGFDAMRLRFEGHPDQAWELLRIGLQASHHMRRHGGLTDAFIGNALGKLTSDCIIKWAQDSVVTTDLLLRAQDELADELRGQPCMSSALQIEYLSVRATMLSPTLAKDLRWIGGAWRFPEVGRLALYSMGEPELSTRSLSHVVGNVLSQIDKPKRERTRQSVSGFTGRYGCFEPDPAVAVSSPTLSQLEKGLGHSILCLLFAPGFSAVVLSTDQVEVRNSLLKTVLALEIYRRGNGGYPETLTQLVPEFMSEVPDDIFEASPTPLKYRRDGDQALIWSVGQNGVDDAGNVETGKDMGYLLGPKQPKPSKDSSGDPAQMPE